MDVDDGGEHEEEDPFERLVGRSATHASPIMRDASPLPVRMHPSAAEMAPGDATLRTTSAASAAASTIRVIPTITTTTRFSACCDCRRPLSRHTIQLGDPLCTACDRRRAHHIHGLALLKEDFETNKMDASCPLSPLHQHALSNSLSSSLTASLMGSPRSFRSLSSPSSRAAGASTSASPIEPSGGAQVASDSGVERLELHDSGGTADQGVLFVRSSRSRSTKWLPPAVQ
jgi:hypothetical protein